MIALINIPVTDLVMCWNAREGMHLRVLSPSGKDVSYACGKLPPRYPMPATLRDSVSDLSVRWSNWMDKT